jgi:hypothetical protein
MFTGSEWMDALSGQTNGKWARLTLPAGKRSMRTESTMLQAEHLLSPKETVMVSQQGDLALLDHPVAQELVQSPLPCRFAYVRAD